MPRVGLLALLATLLAPAAARAADATVTATNFSFSPQQVTITKGEKVTWNNGGGTHNVRVSDGFVAPNPPSSSAWSVEHTFPAAGTYTYFCDVHGSSMSGTVVVEPKTYTWEGGVAAWLEPANWAPDGLPGPDDTAVITSGSPYVNGSTTVGTLNISGTGSAGGSGTLAVEDGGTWTGNAFSFGKTLIGQGATVTWTGGSLNNAAEVENQGTLHVGGLTLGSSVAHSPVLDNAGTMTLTGDLLDTTFGGGELQNSGTIASSGDRTLTPQLANTGDIAVTSGTLQLRGGTAVDSPGDITVAPGATLHFAAGTYVAAAGGTIGGLGRVLLGGGRLRTLPGSSAQLGMIEIGPSQELVVDGNATVGVLRVDGGKRLGSGTLTVQDDLDLPGNAFFVGSGVTIVAPDESFGANTLQIDRGHRMRFEQDLVRTGGFLMIGNSVLEDPGGDAGTFEVGGALSVPSGTALGPTDGTGILRLLPSGTWTFPAGDYEINAVPEWQGTASLPGRLIAYNGAMVSGGTTTLTGSIAEGDVLMSGGTLTGDGTIDGQALRMSGGTLAPTGAFTTDGLVMTGGTLSFGGATHQLATTYAQLNGALAVTGGFAPADPVRIIASGLAPEGNFTSVPDGFEVTKDARGVLLKATAKTAPAVDPPVDPTNPQVEPTVVPTVAPTPAATAAPTPAPLVAPAATPTLAELLELPACARKRAVRVSLRGQAKSVKALLSRKTLKRSTRAFTLRRLPKRAFTLKFEVTLEDGRVVKGSKRFRACRK